MGRIMFWYLNLFFIFVKFLSPLYKHKKFLLHILWVLAFLIIIISNYEFIRYKKINKNGVEYTYDRFTGNKWKNLK